MRRRRRLTAAGVREDPMSSSGDGRVADKEALEASLRNAREAAEPTDAGEALAALRRQLFGARDEGSSAEGGVLRLGRFELRRVLGRGAMGVVYEAWDPELARTVALKRLSIAALQRPGEVHAVERLRREARAMARVDDQHVLRVYDVDEARGQPFVAMEYAPFGSLASWLETPRSIREVVAALISAGRGLAAAHRAGLIHRDVKPSNMLCGSDGCIKVGDFGLVSEPAPRSRVDGEATSTDLRTLGALGTPAYMAPEVWAGDAAGPAADQYSFCVVLYEALYRCRPFAGRPDRSVLPSPRTADGRRVPRALRRTLARGLAYEPRARFGAIDELLAALERWQSERPAGRYAFAALAAALLLAAIMAGAPRVLAALQQHERGTPEPGAAVIDFAGWGKRLAAAQLDFAGAARARAALIAVMQTARARDPRAGFPDLAVLFQHDATLRQRWFRARHAFDTALGSRLIGRIPTVALALGEQSHPFVQFNLAARQLEQAGLPLSAAQRERARLLGERYERAVRERASSYDGGTLPQRQFLDEAELKHDSDVAFREALSSKQRAALVVLGGEHVLTWDEYGPASMLSEVVVPVALSAAARAELPQTLRGAATELLALSADNADPKLAPVFEEMAAAVAPHILSTRGGQLAITVDDALACVRAMEGARRRLLELLPERYPTRAALASGLGYAVFYTRSPKNAPTE